MMHLVTKPYSPRGSGRGECRNNGRQALPLLVRPRFLPGNQKGPGLRVIRRWGAPHFWETRLQVAFFSYRKETKRTRATMAAKNTLKYKRNRLPPLLEISNKAIDYCLRAIRSPDFKGTISDLIQLIRLRFKLAPPEQAPTTARWVDRPTPTEIDREFDRPVPT